MIIVLLIYCNSYFITWCIPTNTMLLYFRSHLRMFQEASPSWQTLHWGCLYLPALCSAFYIMDQRWQERKKPAVICYAQSYCKGETIKNVKNNMTLLVYSYILMFIHIFQVPVASRGKWCNFSCPYPQSFTSSAYYRRGPGVYLPIRCAHSTSRLYARNLFWLASNPPASRHHEQAQRSVWKSPPTVPS